DPFGLGALLAYAAAGVRVLDPSRSIPDRAPGIDRVDEDPDAALPVDADRGGHPRAAARRGDALGIERARDVARRSAGEVVAVDPAHDVRLRGIDDALGDGADAVAVGPAAAACT